MVESIIKGGADLGIFKLEYRKDSISSVGLHMHRFVAVLMMQVFRDPHAKFNSIPDFMLDLKTNSAHTYILRTSIMDSNR